nr:reverse transcriptase domain-containing protein [Tanacetum cinerariifolium]
MFAVRNRIGNEQVPQDSGKPASDAALQDKRSASKIWGEIHHIKQRDEESTEEFVRIYKLECRDVKGAPECMKISGFMHQITSLESIKRQHDKIPKSVDEMIRVTTTFLKGEAATSNHERKKSFPSWKQQEFGQKKNFKKGGLQNQQRWHTMDECMHLMRQIDEMIKVGKLSHLIKELKQSNVKDQAKAAKKGKASGKDKPLAILMEMRILSVLLETTPNLATRATEMPLSFSKEPRIVDFIDLNGATRYTTRLRLFCFSLRDQAINWLDRLPAGSISTWDDLTTRFLA